MCGTLSQRGVQPLRIDNFSSTSRNFTKPAGFYTHNHFVFHNPRFWDEAIGVTKRVLGVRVCSPTLTLATFTPPSF